MKKFTSIFMCLTLCIIPFNKIFANNENKNIDISSKSAILMDVSSGQIIYERLSSKTSSSKCY